MQNISHIDWATERPDLTDLDKPFNIKAYMENRAIYKVKRYFMLSKRSEKLYKTIAVSVLIFSALVPVILGTSIIHNVKWSMFLASLSSFLVVVLFSVESVYNFREQWRSYKNAEDEITQELNLFHTAAEPYNGKNHEKEKLLVMRVEGIILKERKETIEKLTSKIKELEKSPQVTGGVT
jgi:ABC-type multidrug transport system fused ATPase/permease subunit